MLSIARPAWAQDALRAAGEPVRLAGGADRPLLVPLASPDGSWIAVTGPGYRGLWLMRPDGTGLRQLTDEPAAGFGFEWSSDGRALVTRVARFEGTRRLNAVKLFDAGSGEGRLLTDFRPLMPALPHWAPGDDRIVLFSRGRMELFDAGPPATDAGKSAAARAFFLKEDRIASAPLAGGAVSTLGPPGDARVLNLVVSPDRSRLAFEVMGGNLYVMRADGSGLVDLGPGNRPRWSPDGRHLVYMIAEDDGYRFTDSELYAVRADGSGRAQLTRTPDRLEMNPSWAADGRAVLFDDIEEGAVYRLAVE